MVSYIAWVRGFLLKKIVPIIKNQAVNLQTNQLIVSQRASHFLVVLLLILSTKIYSQQQLPRIEQNGSHTLRISGDFRLKFFQSQFGMVFKLSEKTGENVDHYFIDGNIAGPRYHYFSSKKSVLPFFCRNEIMFEKATSIPLRFRLGSLDYVNKLEGKH
jgi:hypothetical protein